MFIFAHEGHNHAAEALAQADQSGNNLPLLLGIGCLLVVAGVVMYLVRPKTHSSKKKS